jgi:hypothetical protein
VFGKALPITPGRREVALAADEQAGFLVRLADRRQRNGAGACHARAAKAGGQVGLFLCKEPCCDGNAAVGRIGTAAGKDEFPGHEGMTGMAPAHQHLDVIALAVKQD